jgi:hypothetical protein
MSKIEEAVITKIRERAELGRKKYGTTMERTDLTTLNWLKLHQEELMDAAIYCEKLIQLFSFPDTKPADDETDK